MPPTWSWIVLQPPRQYTLSTPNHQTRRACRQGRANPPQSSAFPSRHCSISPLSPQNSIAQVVLNLGAVRSNCTRPEPLKTLPFVAAISSASRGCAAPIEAQPLLPRLLTPQTRHQKTPHHIPLVPNDLRRDSPRAQKFLLQSTTNYYTYAYTQSLVLGTSIFENLAVKKLLAISHQPELVMPPNNSSTTFLHCPLASDSTQQ